MMAVILKVSSDSSLIKTKQSQAGLHQINKLLPWDCTVLRCVPILSPEAIGDGSRHLQVSYFISRQTSPSLGWCICFHRQHKAELYNTFSTPLLNRFYSRTYLCFLFCERSPQTNEQVTCSWQSPLASPGSPLWSFPAMYNHIFQCLCRIIDVHGLYAAQTFFLVWKHGLSSIICPTVCKAPDYGPPKKYRKPS